MTTTGYSEDDALWIQNYVWINSQSSCGESGGGEGSGGSGSDPKEERDDKGEGSGGSGGGEGSGGSVSAILSNDSCPTGDYSASYYDGICGEAPNLGTVMTPSPSQYCRYTDGRFQEYVFIDVQNTQYTHAVQTLLQHCLVHGYNNAGVEFGINNSLKLGELYKVFVRLSMLDFNLNYPGKGWSYGYYLAGNAVGLWNNINTNRSQDAIVTQEELRQVINNYVAYIGADASILDTVQSGNMRSITRGNFAIIVDMLVRLTAK